MKERAVRVVRHVKHHGLLLFVFGFLVLTLITTLSSLNQKTNTQTHAESPATGQINKKVYVLIYDPIMPNGQALSVYKGWASPAVLTQNYINFFRQVSNNRINYSVAATTTLQTFPKKFDGYLYTAQTYLSVLANPSTHHVPDKSDYSQFFTDQALDICGKVNRGEIDEVWLYGGPYMGFAESALASKPGGRALFAYNDGDSNISTTTCNRLMPIMGFSYEAGFDNMVHDMSHRTEATMSYVFGGWNEDKMGHSWEMFALDHMQSPSYGAAGCGDAHYPPNAGEYIYNSQTSVLSYCDNFLTYPTLGNPIQTARSINCQAWGCTPNGYYTWWFNHIPHFDNSNSDGVLNGWWQYIIDPNKTPATQPSYKGFRSESANLLGNQATFNFSYAGWSASFRVDISTASNMSTDVYHYFVSSPTTDARA